VQLDGFDQRRHLPGEHGNAVTTNQQIETDLSKKTHPPTHS
jgi:hypothetical protein